MQKRDVEKIKTFLDFEEFEKDFEQALIELETLNECNPGHFLIWIEPWSDQQLDDFNNMVWDTAEEICHTLIGNNLRYNSAYWWVRKACKEKYGDASIPYFVHTFEKTLRTQTVGDNEDSEKDRVGYELLEYVCRRLEKKWETNDPEVPTPTIDPDQPLDEPEPDKEDRFVKDFEDLIEKIPIKFNGRTCINCGEELKGKRRKYCNMKCREDFRNGAAREKIKSLKEV